ncbi:hypothetical protein K438DRAFT_1432287, partial [Mycena galopus ATCC 62051]
ITMSTPELVNPNTPLAYIPADLGTQYQVSRYVFIATLGAFVWDLCMNMDSDYRLLFKHKIRHTTVVYFISRIATLSYVFTAAVFAAVEKIPSCQTEQLINGISSSLAASFTSLLFLFRVLAVFNNGRWAMVSFIGLWIVVVGCSVTVPLGIGGAHIGPTQACINTRVATYTAASGIASFANDSIVFIAISYRIISYTLMESSTIGALKTFFTLRALPVVSRNLLFGGQLYYFVALCANLALIGVFAAPHIGPIYRGMLTIPIAALNNAMACLVFRKVKFGLIAND